METGIFHFDGIWLLMNVLAFLSNHLFTFFSPKKDIFFLDDNFTNQTKKFLNTKTNHLFKRNVHRNQQENI